MHPFPGRSNARPYLKLYVGFTQNNFLHDGYKNMGKYFVDRVISDRNLNFFEFN